MHPYHQCHYVNGKKEPITKEIYAKRMLLQVFTWHPLVFRRRKETEMEFCLKNLIKFRYLC